MANSYGLTWMETPAAFPSYAVVPALIYIAETINATLTNVVLTGTETLANRRKLHQQETEIGRRHVQACRIMTSKMCTKRPQH